VSTSFAPVVGSAVQAALDELASQRRAAAARIEAARVRRCQIDQRLEQIRLRLRQLADASPAGPTEALPVAQPAACAEHSARQDGAAFMWLELAHDRLATAFDAVLDLWQVREEQLARCERLNWDASCGSHGWEPPR
jgi:hypothetical protein